MKFRYDLTDKISEFIRNCDLEEISIGCSDSQVIKIKKTNDLYFLKIAKRGMLTSEFEKLKWLDEKLSVPKVILYDLSDDTEFLITEAVKGEMVCTDYYINNPNIGISVLADAFKQIHSVNIEDCPFDVSIDYKLSLVENNINNKLINVNNLKEETLKKYGSLDNILEFLKENKFYDTLCFSHGDTSLPNIFASDDRFVGFIDVGVELQINGLI
jgi:kanamycin kinase/aminoglycoside 3'-phosphotransferase-3